MTFDVARYAGGRLAQSYCHEMTLAVWFTLRISPGVSAANASPRLGFFLPATAAAVGVPVTDVEVAAGEVLVWGAATEDVVVATQTWSKEKIEMK